MRVSKCCGPESGDQDDLAAGGVLLDELVCAGCLGERKLRPDLDLEVTIRQSSDRERNGLGTPGQLLRRQRLRCAAAECPDAELSGIRTANDGGDAIVIGDQLLRHVDRLVRADAVQCRRDALRYGLSDAIGKLSPFLAQIKDSAEAIADSLEAAQNQREAARR